MIELFLALGGVTLLWVVNFVLRNKDNNKQFRSINLLKLKLIAMEKKFFKNTRVDKVFKNTIFQFGELRNKEEKDKFQKKKSQIDTQWDPSKEVPPHSKIKGKKGIVMTAKDGKIKKI